MAELSLEPELTMANFRFDLDRPIHCPSHLPLDRPILIYDSPSSTPLSYSHSLPDSHPRKCKHYQAILARMGAHAKINFSGCYLTRSSFARGTSDKVPILRACNKFAILHALAFEEWGVKKCVSPM